MKHVSSASTQLGTVLERAKLVFHVVGVGRGALMSGAALSLCLKTDMMGRRTSLLAIEKGAAALEAHDGTYLRRGELTVSETSNARNAKLRDL